jgi:hypothetical protein
MEPIPPCLKPGEKEAIVYFHDESAFHMNDYQWYFWLKNDEQVLKKKEQGWLIMTSDFISNKHRALSLTNELCNTESNLPLEE